MASIKDQILTGMVGPVILSHRYGKPYIRSKPSVVKTHVPGHKLLNETNSKPSMPLSVKT